MAQPPVVFLAFAAACSLSAAVPGVAAAQHITIDRSFGSPTTLPGPNYAITANLGKQVGSNLFHSFGKFGLASSESATFSGPATVSNVIGRVTGGAQSGIDGKIASTITGASLYLINPSGIVFGPNATVDVSGGFHASTADYLRMSDGAKFQATNPDASTLSAAPPAAFGFLTSKPAALTVNGSSLGVPSGQMLGLVGGPVSINSAATLSAPAGTIHVTSAAGTGEVPVDPRNTAALTVTSFGPVHIKGNSTLDVSDPNNLGSGGSVFIRSGALTINASEINADNYGSGAGGSLVLRGESQVTLTNGTFVHALTLGGPGASVAVSTTPTGVILADASTVATGGFGAGNAGPLSISTGQLTLTNGATLTSLAQSTGNSGGVTVSAGGALTIASGGQISTITTGSGRAGDVSVSSAGALSIDGTSGPIALTSIGTGIGSQTGPGNTGNAGNTTVTAGTAAIVNAGRILNISSGAGDPGSVFVGVDGKLSIDGAGIPAGVPVLTGISSQTALGSGSTANAGSVTVNAGGLSIAANGAILSATFGSGDAGGVSVRVAGELSIDGANSFLQTGIVSSGVTGNAASVMVSAGDLSIINSGLIAANSFGTGNGGNLVVNAGNLTIGANSEIEADTFGMGKAGNIAVTVTGPLSIDGTAAIIPTGITAFTFGIGKAGDVKVDAGSLAITNGGQISASTAGAGAAGDVAVSVTGDLLLNGAGISSNTVARSLGGGNAGTITVTAGNLTILTDGQIGSGTFGSGNAGSILVSVPGTLTIDGTSATVLTGITSNNAVATSTGSAGTVTVTAGTLNIVNNGQIASVTFGSGDAGRVSVNVVGTLTIDGTKANTNFRTGITTDAEPGSKGSAGSMTVSADDLSIINGGTISSGALGAEAGLAASTGNGGNIKVNVSGLLSINGGSAIATDTDPGTVGKAGNVTVNAGALRLADFGRISSETAGGGDGGSVIVNAGTLAVSPNGQITTDTFASGAGGNIAVNVTGALSIDGTSSTVPTGITALTSGTKNAGNVSVSAGTLTIGTDGVISTDTFAAGRGGNIDVTVTGALSIDGTAFTVPTGITALTALGTGDAGNVSVNAGSISLVANGLISVDTLLSTGNAGNITVNVAGALSINAAGITSETGFGTGSAGQVRVAADSVTITNGGAISASTVGAGAGGNVTVSSGSLAINGGKISASTFGAGPGGDVTVTAGTLSIANLGEVASATTGIGNGGTVSVSVSGQLSIEGTPGDFLTGIAASAQEGSTGNAGNVTVHAGAASIVNNKGEITSSTLGRGNGGEVSVDVAGLLSIDGGPTTSLTGIAALTENAGNAGNVFVNARELAIVNNGQIAVSTLGSGAGGDVAVTVAGPITLSSGGQVTAATAGAGNGGTVQVSAQGLLSLSDPGSGIIALATSAASGDAGSVAVGAPQITLTSGAEISSTTAGTGAGGSVDVRTSGALVLDGAGVANTQIAASATGPKSGAGGSVTVGADSLTVEGGARIAASTAGPGKGGDVAVTVANGVNLSGTGPGGVSGITASAEIASSGQAGEVVLTAGGAIAIGGGARVTSSTAGKGDAGTVRVDAQGPLSLSDPGSGILVSASPTASGNAGSVTVTAPQIALLAGAEISSTTAGTGAGGSVKVATPGTLVLDGAGIGNTQIAASAIGPRSGPGGSVTVAADALTVEGGARIASTTFGPGKAGDIAVTVAHDATLSGSGQNGASGITASAQPGSTGPAGQVVLTARGALALSDGAKATSSTAGAGAGGTVQVTAGGPLTLTGFGTGIIASATSTASGDAGSVTVAAPQITIGSGAEIASTTAGTGAGGSVGVTTSGALVLNGAGDRDTQIAASAIGPQSGPGGSVTVAAGALTIEGGARIASSTAGPGKGGDVNIAVATDIVLPDPGPQITARSTGSGDAGSITVSAVRLLMNNGASISTEAETSTANGGNITLHLRDFLHLVSSEISTSVKGETGNGGNIVIDPQLVILNHSSIIAQAIEGHGGNITIAADQFIPSSDSIISATSELGISGTIVINGPRVDVNGALVVLSSQLRGRTEVLREACEARADQRISSFVEAGRGGLPQDPEATLPALYIAGRELNPNPQTAAFEPSGSPRHTTARLTMRCG